ncbi:3,4-dihydroxy 2-butanone 4-phosphate synthase / GTP cyclohydrolase II [Limimonas halophila]|uniref:3,4-dihydroxy-2-butanone 4-phosphate synthase n=1 Tax=Limimonas halophila TaxID=1082479 RepID=A0A1G7NVP8_9PROT|nr:3,4-dihydroxy-2-butanone-4-phosphate synthase [Limimonas halophila]SDF78084.1 3,4-dihydroxy 2-butanone 4-phosphate synthase / GTP cyclohydrolase II [Limimonas halophila]
MDDAADLAFSEVKSPIEDIIADARNGRLFILVDDEDRENEGDLVIPAQMATPAAVNFMAKYGRGLICLALTNDRVGELGLPMMARQNQARHGTAFTVSIEAREGVSTGISAPDRAHTIATAVDPEKGAGDIVTPGHVFPLAARDGGVLVRAGHTEAAVDVARLAGLNPSGVICEIMNDDGSMARRDDLVKMARAHGLRIGTIADLIAYRRRHDRIVERRLETDFESVFGGQFRMALYVNTAAYAEHLALWKGDPADGEPMPVRMHALNVMDDVLGDAQAGKVGEVQAAMRMIGEMGRGVVVLIREPTPTALSDRIRARMGEGPRTQAELRDYGVGAQILLDLGVRDMVLLSNTRRTVVGLQEGYGLRIVEQRPIERPESLPIRTKGDG